MHDLAGQVQHGGVVVQDEIGVRRQHDAVQLEGQPVRVLTDSELVPADRGGGETADQRAELRLERGDQVPDRSGPGAELQGRGSP